MTLTRKVIVEFEAREWEQWVDVMRGTQRALARITKLNQEAVVGGEPWDAGYRCGTWDCYTAFLDERLDVEKLEDLNTLIDNWEGPRE